MKKIVLLSLLLMLSACGHVDLNLTEQSVVYYDSPVVKSKLQVSVHPRGKQYRPLTAYCPPFFIQQQTSDYDHLGAEFATLFYNIWAEKMLFTTMEYGKQPRWKGLEYSLQKAQFLGADLLVYGTIPYFYAGHTMDDTAITVKIKIYDVATGTVLWDMAQSGRIEEKMPKDFVYFLQKNRLPTAPFSVILRDLANDMAIPLGSWLPAPDSAIPFAYTAGQMKTGLSTVPSQLPATGLLTNEQLLPADGGTTNDSMSHSKNGPTNNSTSGSMNNESQTGQGVEFQPNSVGVASNGAKTLPAAGAWGMGGTQKPMSTQESAEKSSSGETGEALTRPESPSVYLDINFETDKSTIKAESYKKLDDLAKAIQSPQLANKKMIIAGHTDAMGGEQHNKKLSLSRADAVKRYLIEKHGIDPARMKTAGYGSSRPVAGYEQAGESLQNRRVEIRVME